MSRIRLALSPMASPRWAAGTHWLMIIDSWRDAAQGMGNGVPARHPRLDGPHWLRPPHPSPLVPHSRPAAPYTTPDGTGAAPRGARIDRTAARSPTRLAARLAAA